MNITGVSSFNWDIDPSQGSQKRTSVSVDGGFAAKVLAGSTVSDTVTLLAGASDTPLDFRSMTRSELISAAQQLRSEGKLSGDEAAVLEGFAVAYAARPGEQLRTEYSLADGTKYDFVEMITQASIADHSSGNSIAAANDDALLKVLTQAKINTGVRP